MKKKIFVATGIFAAIAAAAGGVALWLKRGKKTKPQSPESDTPVTASPEID